MSTLVKVYRSMIISILFLLFFLYNRNKEHPCTYLTFTGGVIQ